MRGQRWAVAVLGAMVLAGGAAGCSRSSSSSSPAGRIDVDGQAEISRPGEDRREITGSRDLEVGDRVRILRGTAVVRMPEERRFEMRLGSDVELQGAAEPKQVRLALIGGDLLVMSGPVPLTIDATGADIAVQGDARISRGVALLVAAYKGTAQMSAAGSTLNVAALRQGALPATGQFPVKATPLEFSPSDGWDQRYLSDAIELSTQLTARSQGYTAQLGPTEGRTFSTFRELFPRLAAEPGFTAALVNPARPPGETLVGAAVTLEGSRGTFAERWAAVFAFRDDGAPWGLVALDQGVGRIPLLASIGAAVSRGPTQFASAPPPRPSTTPAPRSSGAPSTTVRPVPTTVAPPRPGATTTTVPPFTPTAPGPLNTGTPVLDNTVNSLVNTLTGLLRSLGGQP